MEKIELEREKEKLKKTIEIIGEILEDENLDLKKLYTDFVGDREELWRIADRKKIHITNLETALDKPYFARIDFKSEEDGKVSTVYIGKNGVIKNTDIIVTDWRAPISSLYYDASVGKCSYEAPNGTIKGNMSLKRQFEIENGELQEYFDVDLVSQDSLLQKYLNDNNDAFVIFCKRRCGNICTYPWSILLVFKKGQKAWSYIDGLFNGLFYYSHSSCKQLRTWSS